MQSLQASLFPDHHLSWSLLKPQVLRGEGQRALAVCVCVYVCVNNLRQVTSHSTEVSQTGLHSLADSLKVCFPTGAGDEPGGMPVVILTDRKWEKPCCALHFVPDALGSLRCCWRR